jgi:hypothetical protein
MEAEKRRVKQLGVSNKDIFKIIDDENLANRLNQKGDRLGSVSAMKYLEFGFGLGYNEDGEVSFNAYCLDREGWSNGLNCEPEYLNPCFKMIGFWNIELEDNKKEISRLLKKYKNKLFICKERSKTEDFNEGTLTWHWFPESPSIKGDKTFRYTEDLTEIKKLVGEFENE